MSDYKRFVSYIYGYKQGEKGESTGFVKVNARGEECKIWVHVRGFYTHHQEPYRVYAFKQKKEGLEGQYLGELESRNGALEWNGVTKTDSLMGGFSLEESRGIYIDGGNRIYAAEWDDYPVDVERFTVAGEPIKRTIPEPKPELKKSGQFSTVDLETELDRRTTALYAADLPADIPDVETEKPEQSSEKENEANSEGEAAAAENTPEPLIEPEVPATPPEPIDPKKDQWQYLVNHFPVMRYQDRNGGVISSIRLGNRDLTRIPRDKWELGNNSFLLHGFYQYKHLLLLRRETDEQIGYYLGVPGVYNEKEQMLASMFGFEEFRVIKGQETRDGSFGYWCRALRA